jgi:hypothetical protein
MAYSSESNLERRIMASVIKPTPYSELAKLIRIRSDDPFYLALALNNLVTKGRLAFWESSRFYVETEPCYAPAGMKKPRGWKQPRRTLQ